MLRRLLQRPLNSVFELVGQNRSTNLYPNIYVTGQSDKQIRGTVCVNEI